jgi:hypothetical protein
LWQICNTTTGRIGHERDRQERRVWGVSEGTSDGAADCGIVPRDIMEDEEVVKVLPVLFRTLRREKPSESDLNRLVRRLRTA